MNFFFVIFKECPPVLLFSIDKYSLVPNKCTSVWLSLLNKRLSIFQSVVFATRSRQFCRVMSSALQAITHLTTFKMEYYAFSALFFLSELEIDVYGTNECSYLFLAGTIILVALLNRVSL